MRVLPPFFETLLLERSYDHVIPIANSVFNLPKPQFPHLSVLSLWIVVMKVYTHMKWAKLGT